MSASQETLTALFLAELSGLDAFAARREADGVLALGSDDPDVRRILEAMAFFSARTRAVAAEQTAAAVRRIAAGTLDDLLGTEPAAMMVECANVDGVVARTVLPRGTLLRAETADGMVALLSTIKPFVIQPLAVTTARIVEERHRLLLRVDLRAAHPQKGPLQVSLFVRRLDDYRASLALHDAIERHLVAAFARPAASDCELPCQVHFHATPDCAHEECTDDRGPLARIRSFFHLPEQDLFIHLAVPASPSPWTSLELFFELDETFPSNLSVSSDTFRVNVVAAQNSWLDFADAIMWDGTKSSAPVRNARVLLDCVEPGTVRGVYRDTDKGLVPLLPAALARGGDTYEVENDEGGMQLLLSLPGSFERPSKILPEVVWSQPRLWSMAPGRLNLSLQTRHLPGVVLRCSSGVRAPRLSPLERFPARALDILSLRMRPMLSRRDVVGMLEILGAGEEGAYRGFASLVQELICMEAPDPQRRAAGVRRVYKLALRERTPEEAPQVRRLAAQVASLLDSWTEEPVDTEVDMHPSGAPAWKVIDGGDA
jgi:type VI secretion system protein ImpG